MIDVQVACNRGFNFLRRGDKPKMTGYGLDLCFHEVPVVRVVVSKRNYTSRRQDGRIVYFLA